MDPCLVKLTVRIPPDLVEFVDQRSAELERSRNWVIVDLVRKAADNNDTTTTR